MADTPAILIAEPVDALRRAQQGKGYWKRVWERLRRDKVTLAMAAILASLLIMVIFAPWFTLHDPYQGSVLRRLKPIGFPGHWLGTDEVGRDLWSRMVYGGRLSLLAGVMPVFLALLIGGFLGILAGYAGGLVNSAIMRVIDVLYAFPSVLLAIAITGILGAGLGNTILALTIAFVPPLVRISEAVTTQSRNLDFVEAARASGAGTLKILQYHILNNVLGPILVYATSLISIGIILAAGLSFLGLGVTPPSAEWGLMLNNLRQAIWVDPVICALPGVMIFITSMCFNLLSDGLTKHFPLRGGLLNRAKAVVQAVDDVSFEVAAGETLGLVGESGCGKSTTARLLMHLVPLDRGTIAFDGMAIGAGEDLSRRDLHRQMQMVFQDSYASLNPRLPVSVSIAFGPLVHGLAKSAALS